MKRTNMKVMTTVLLCAVGLGCASTSSTRKPASESPEESNEFYRDPTAPVAESSDRRVPMQGVQTEPAGGMPEQGSKPATTPERSQTADRESTGDAPRGGSVAGSDADNTRVNKRDADEAALTPIDQGNSTEDLRITKAIRQAVVADDALSFTAKNVKIITLNGKVTLRGPVNSDSERSTVEAAARRVAGATHVDNQLEVKR